MQPRMLTKDEYNYCWYIEYGQPYHYIEGHGMIGQVIKTLLADGICIQLPNPTLEKSPLYTRFTKEGRHLFFVHEWLMFFRHPTELPMIYDEYMDGYDIVGKYAEWMEEVNPKF
jgi:hypothetical protein